MGTPEDVATEKYFTPPEQDLSKMIEQKLKGAIAEQFKIARQEGVIRRFADGLSDADDTFALIEAAGYRLVDPAKLTVLSDEEIMKQTRAPVVLSGHRRIASAALADLLRQLGVKE